MINTSCTHKIVEYKLHTKSIYTHNPDKLSWHESIKQEVDRLFFPKRTYRFESYSKRK